MNIDQELLTKVRKENIEFRRLHDEHLKLKDRVEELNRMKFLSTEQEVEKKKIQKQKLKNKDRMLAIIDDYQAKAH